MATTEYRIILTATFDNATDRDTWYTKIKNAFVSAKPTSPSYKIAHATKDDYVIADRSTEEL